MQATIFDDTPCTLGEGPLWHPERAELFWCDITAGRLYARGEDGARRDWQFDGAVSALGWVDRDTLLIAQERALLRFDIAGGTFDTVIALESDMPHTRSNDGRADPFGGFWIGTMGHDAEKDAGAIYRYHKGELRQLYAPWTIPNAQCFSPDGAFAYLTDTTKGGLLRVALDRDGWPKAEPEPFGPLDGADYRPDGAVTDAEGNIWIAHYGKAMVSCHAPADGAERARIALPASQTTCPAFGGAGLDRLFVTSATQKLSLDQLAEDPQAGCTFVVETGARGLPEHRVIL